jgi:hypothetical protein
MKTRHLSADIAWKCLPAVLLAAQLTVGFAPQAAWAQSAQNPGNGDDQLRLGQPANAGTADRNTFDRTSDPNRDTAGDPDADDQAADPNAAAAGDADPDEDKNATLDAAVLKELRRQNPREESVDNLDPKKAPDDDLTPGIAVGSFTFRPTLSETLGDERTRTGKNDTTRTYLQTGFKGSLVSDWSLHQLKIDAEGTWQKTMSGIPQDDPEGKIDAALRLDLSEATKANLKVGYSLEREDISAANAIANATNQAEVSTYTANAEITRDLGLIRGTAGIDFSRQTYGDAQLDNGKFVSQEDRDANTATLRGRIGYELSPALIPFLEASYGRTIYDNHKDTLGFIRDAELYAIKTGITADFGEKLRGEISTGYAIADFEDERLKSISAITFDGNATWSPQRGTDVELGLKTEIEPSTSAGASGDVAYTANAALTQAIIDTLSGRLTAATTWRDYSLSTVPNQTVIDLGTGLTWGLSRSLDFNADIAWERTSQPGVPRSDVFTAGIGLSLKR